jgi:hypothetical protein
MKWTEETIRNHMALMTERLVKLNDLADGTKVVTGTIVFHLGGTKTCTAGYDEINIAPYPEPEEFKNG